MRHVVALVVLCALASVAWGVSEPMRARWEPHSENTVTADRLVFSRQTNHAGAYASVCEATLSEPQCVDTAVPAGTHCFQVQVFAGQTPGPVSAPICRTYERFEGVLILEFTGTGTLSMQATPQARPARKSKRY